ncbi:hypothetical protein FQA39_LY10127 [Lamprigera yunnana]|nr:hypothetical protein FQA39_LY10127 [Lamprigera yunnana]
MHKRWASVFRLERILIGNSFASQSWTKFLRVIKSSASVKIEYSGDINDFVNVNLNLTTSSAPNEDNILESVGSKHVESGNSEVEEDDDVTTDRLTLK